MSFRNRFISLKVLHYHIVLIHVSVVLGQWFSYSGSSHTVLSSLAGHKETRKHVRRWHWQTLLMLLLRPIPQNCFCGKEMRTRKDRIQKKENLKKYIFKVIGPVYARHRQGDIRWLPADAPYIKLPLQGHLVLNFSISSSYLHTNEGARIRRNMVFYQTWLWRRGGRNPDTDSHGQNGERTACFTLITNTHTGKSLLLGPTDRCGLNQQREVEWSETCRQNCHSG